MYIPICSRYHVGIPKVADGRPCLPFLFVSYLSIIVNIPRCSFGIAETYQIMTQFISPTIGRTTPKDMEPYRLADIFFCRWKQQAAIAQIIADSFVFAGFITQKWNLHLSMFLFLSTNSVKRRYVLFLLKPCFSWRKWLQKSRQPSHTLGMWGLS